MRLLEGGDRLPVAVEIQESLPQEQEGAVSFRVGAHRLFQGLCGLLKAALRVADPRRMVELLCIGVEPRPFSGRIRRSRRSCSGRQGGWRFFFSEQRVQPGPVQGCRQEHGVRSRARRRIHPPPPGPRRSGARAGFRGPALFPEGQRISTLGGSRESPRPNRSRGIVLRLEAVPPVDLPHLHERAGRHLHRGPYGVAVCSRLPRARARSSCCGCPRRCAAGPASR